MFPMVSPMLSYLAFNPMASPMLSYLIFNPMVSPMLSYLVFNPMVSLIAAFLCSSQRDDKLSSFLVIFIHLLALPINVHWVVGSPLPFGFSLMHMTSLQAHF